METARIFKTYKFRLYPTDEQAARLDQWFAASRWIYNAALEPAVPGSCQEASMSNAAIEIINLEIQDLKKRLAELQQALETLRASDGKKSTTQGRGPNSAFTVHSETLDVLQEASDPMTVQEIVDAINANGLVRATRSAVDAALRRLREKKLADRIPDSQPRQWVAVFQSDLSTQE